MENKNTIIALVLMLVVWIGFSFVNPPQPPQSAPEVVETAAPAPAVVEAARPALVEPVPAVTSVAGIRRELVVENDVFRAVFTSAGARLKSLQLKRFTETSEKGAPHIALLDVDPDRLATLRTGGSDGLSLSDDLPFSPSLEGDLLQLGGDQSRSLTFTAVTPAGLQVVKTYTFRGDSYDFDLVLRVVNGGSTPVSGNLTLSLLQPWDDSMETSQFDFVGPATLVAEEMVRDDIDDLAEEPKAYLDVLWSSFQTKYFMTAAVPLQGAAEKVRVEKGAETVFNIFESPYRTLAPGEALNLSYLLYYGPRDLDTLKAVDHQLAEAIDFGFFGLIAKPLLHVLQFFYSFVGNYGVAIILLTVIIKLIFWPLTQKSYTSMKAMQKLQPQMQKLRDKHKNDRERLNREIMEMYKENRVNPLGGCLPMLVQIPVFFALYKVLLGNIALRHAPFGLWITDLSAKDPYYVTPLIMGATMFVQQKMTPSTMDPAQAKIFMIMPVVFTFMFLNFPSGLVIYWLVNNLLTILQQYFINRKA